MFKLAHRVVKRRSRQAGARSVFEYVVAHGAPAANEILFLRTARTLSRVTVVGMEMRRAIRYGILERNVSLKPLMQVPRLRNVDGRPIAFGQLFGIDVNTGQRAEGGVQRMDPEGVLRPGLTWPIVSGGQWVARMRVATE